MVSTWTSVHLRQGLLHQGAVVVIGGVQQLIEPEGGSAKDDLRVFELLIVDGKRGVQLVGEHLRSLEQTVGLGHVAGLILLGADFHHIANQHSIEEALLLGGSGGGALLQRADHLLVGDLAVVEMTRRRRGWRVQ